jgi:8-oxo-dGTP pyrophosphatase MutT (NUDIX family)
VEQGENPLETARRELHEELGRNAAMVTSVADVPLFLTVVQTRGAGQHTDVSLWYVVAGDEKMWIDADPREFRGYRWRSLEEIKSADISQMDPETHRFIHKLEVRMSWTRATAPVL